MFGQVLFWIAFPIPGQADIRTNPMDRWSPLLPELQEAAFGILTALRRKGWGPTFWDVGYFNDEAVPERLSAIFWTAFPMPDHEDIDINPDDDYVEPKLIPELEDTATEVIAALRKLGWDPHAWEFRSHDDRPPSEVIAADPPHVAGGGNGDAMS